MPTIDALATLSDTELLAEVKRLARNESHGTAAFVASLGALDARRSYLGEGYSSTFTYCVEALGLSEDAAYYRITAARAANRFPLILERLASGGLTLKGVRLLAAHLTVENHVELLDASTGRSTRTIEQLLAARNPRPDARCSVRKLPAPRVAAAPALVPIVPGAVPATLSAADPPGDAAVPSPGDAGETPAAAGEHQSEAKRSRTERERRPDPARSDAMILDPGGDRATGPPATSSPVATAADAACLAAPRVPEMRAHPAVVEPLAPERYKVQLTISAETHAKLRHAQDLLRHQIPDGDLAAVLDRALTVLVADLERKKIAAVGRLRRKCKTPAPSRKAKTMERSDPSGSDATAGHRVPGDGSAGADRPGVKAPSPHVAHEGGRLAGAERAGLGAAPAPSDRPAVSEVLGAAPAGSNGPALSEAPRAVPPASKGEQSPLAAAKSARPVASRTPDTGKVGSPRRSRYIPAAVKRAVWERDRGSCAYVGTRGRCGQTAMLEFHHVVPHAAGGEATVDGIELRCRAHNQHDAAQFFGVMNNRTRTTPPSRRIGAPARPGTSAPRLNGAAAAS